MKLTKGQKIAYAVILAFFILFASTIKFPLFAADSERQTLFQSSSVLEISIYFLLLTGVYITFIYIVPLKDIAVQIKSYREPILKLQKTKFEYWLKSELYESERTEQEHLVNIDIKKHFRALHTYDILKKAAELNDMTAETFIKALKAQAEANLINAQSDTESAKAGILLKAVNMLPKMSPMWQAYVISCVTDIKNELTKDPELQKEIDRVVKEKYEQELRKAVIENDNLEFKYKRNEEASRDV